MIVRIWKVDIVEGQGAALESFAESISLPMLQSQPGCLSVIFSRSDNQCATITLWESRESMVHAECSPDYRTVVAKIEQSGIVCGDHQTEVFDVYGGFLDANVTAFLRGRCGD